jgi:hypothetical protein
MFVALSSLSHNPTAVIGSLAFVVTNPRTDDSVVTHYFKTLDWEQTGRGYNFKVLQGMLNKSAMARKAVSDLTVPVQAPDALAAVVRAYNEGECSALWGHAEDIAILRDALAQYKIEEPWTEGEIRDIGSVWATILDLGIAPEVTRGPTEPADVPLGEAAFMARAVGTVYRGFRETKAPVDRVVQEVAGDNSKGP